MSNVTNDQLLERVRKTVDRASLLSELWSDTTAGSVIDLQNYCLKRALKENDLQSVRLHMLSLARTCQMIEDEYNKENGVR